MVNNRAYNIKKAETEVFDLVIIGGGITGAGIALTASHKGWKTLIVEKNDFASGSSSRSAKLIHGGLRYLQQLQIKLVREALLEREHLLNEYPHLVKPQPFFMPIYGSIMNKFKYSIGLTGYDLLSGKSSMPKHSSIGINQIKEKFPEIKADNLVGGYIYYDAKTNDARLTNEVIQQAVELGATAINYMQVDGFNLDENTVKSLNCINTINNNTINIKGGVFISAAGVWTDDILHKFDTKDTTKYMSPSKGIHLVVSNKKLPKDHVLLLPTANNDGRILWCIPWEDDLNIIGTTDTDYNQSIENIWTEKQEIDYILDSVNAQLKDTNFTYDDILSVYAGLRPLINDEDDSKKSNQRSRDYNIWWNNDNMLTISGGKFTSFLSMANSCIETISKKHEIKPSQKSPKSENIVPENLIAKFKERYGIKNAAHITKLIQEDESRKTNISDSNYTIAEVLFFIRYQNALRLGDVLTRRTLISYKLQKWDQEKIDEIVEIMTNELNWNASQIEEELSIYKSEWETMHTWK